MKKFNYINGDLHFWIIQIIFFFSIFTFSAYNPKAELPISKSTQSELVFSKKNISKKIISLEKANSLWAKPFVYLQLIKFLKVDLITFQQLLIVKFKATSQKIISSQKFIFFFPKKIISATLDLDIPILSIR